MKQAASLEEVVFERNSIPLYRLSGIYLLISNGLFGSEAPSELYDLFPTIALRWEDAQTLRVGWT